MLPPVVSPPAGHERDATNQLHAPPLPLVSALRNPTPPALMKTIATYLLAIAAVTLIGACDSHEWSQTKVLHEKFQEHGHGGEHGAAAAHGEKPAH